MYKVKEISEEGNVGVNPVDKLEGTVNQSELTTIDRNTFVKDWAITKCSIEIMEEFPKYDASNDASMTEFTLKHLVMSCMEELIKMHPAPDVRIYKSPQNTIIAMAAFANGDLILVPGTKAITIPDKDEKKNPRNRIELYRLSLNPKSSSSNRTQTRSSSAHSGMWLPITIARNAISSSSTRSSTQGVHPPRIRTTSRSFLSASLVQ
jgi:hypothetical protein